MNQETKSSVQDQNLWTALVTPLTASGGIDFEGLSALIDEQTHAHNGLLLLGSTGEALNLSHSEKKSVLEFTLSKKPGTQIMVGLPGADLEASLEWLSYLETLDVDCYLLPTPLYAKPGPAGQFAWFSEFLKRTKRPVMLYNIPGRAAAKMAPQVVADLKKRFDHLWALKEASGSFDDFVAFKESAPTVKLYSGDDPLFFELHQLGAQGLVSVAANAWPRETRKVVDAPLAQKSFQKEWSAVTDHLFDVSNPIPVKTILKEKGVLSTDATKLPLLASEWDALGTVKKDFLKELTQRDFQLFSNQQFYDQ